MLDVLELENKWTKYHSKKVLPLYITSFVLLIIAGASSYLYIIKPEAVLALLNKEQTQKKVPAVVKVTKSVEPVQVVQVQKTYKQNVLVPSFDFIYNLEDQAINYKNAQQLASVSKPPVTAKKKVIKPPKPKKQKKPATKPKKVARTTKTATIPQKKAVKKKETKTVIKKPVQTVVHSENSNIAPEQALVQVGHSTTSKDELRSVIKRFNKTQNPALSLFIAKKYYDQGDYKESYNYAKATYKLNPNIEDGVLLYTKSLVKLGYQDKALSKLKPYINKSGSIKAKILLNEIQKGNFK